MGCARVVGFSHIPYFHILAYKPHFDTAHSYFFYQEKIFDDSKNCEVICQGDLDTTFILTGQMEGGLKFSCNLPQYDNDRQ